MNVVRVSVLNFPLQDIVVLVDVGPNLGDKEVGNVDDEL